MPFSQFGFSPLVYQPKYAIGAKGFSLAYKTVVNVCIWNASLTGRSWPTTDSPIKTGPAGPVRKMTTVEFPRSPYRSVYFPAYMFG